ncbi:MAG TPA: VWA domain-containing protein [Pyrinomonadaceae bacterium]
METENCRFIYSRTNPESSRPAIFARPQFEGFSFQFSICTAFLFLLVIAFSVTAAGQTPTPSPAKTPTPPDDVDVLRTETDLTNLLFTATDKSNRYVTTLQQNDIRVIEDGVPQTVFTFQRETDRPLAIAFVIDVSISEERTLPDEKAAARSFIESVIRSEKDQAAIIPFEGYAHLEQPLSRDVLSIYRVLESVEVAFPAYAGVAPAIGGVVSGPGTISPPREGSTAIWDAIAVTCKNVLRRSYTQRRRAIILLTDGQDTSSRLTRATAIDQAIEAETVVYAIGIGDRKYDGINKKVLDDIAEKTGGRAFYPKKSTDLMAAFQEIEQELRSQYLLAYSSTNKQHDGKFRSMKIEIANPTLAKDKLNLRYRPGYFAKKDE